MSNRFQIVHGKKGASPDKAVFPAAGASKDAVPDNYAPIEGPAEESAASLPPMPSLRMVDSEERSKNRKGHEKANLEQVQGKMKKKRQFRFQSPR